MTATLIFTTALCFTLWTGFVTLNSRWDVILALLAGRPDPRFGASADADRALALRVEPLRVSPLRASIPSLIGETK
jgi:hypothetical protein